MKRVMNYSWGWVDDFLSDVPPADPPPFIPFQKSLKIHNILPLTHPRRSSSLLTKVFDPLDLHRASNVRESRVKKCHSEIRSQKRRGRALD